jgi:hypothetical protein
MEVGGESAGKDGIRSLAQAVTADRPDGLLIVTPHRLAFLTKITTITTEFLFPTQISSTSKPPG